MKSLSAIIIILALAASASAVPPDTAWVRTYNGTGNGADEIWTAALDQNGNFYCFGKSLGLTSDYDWVVIKYNPAGTPVWTYRYNGTGNGVENIDTYVREHRLVVDDSQYVYIVGPSTGIGSGLDLVTIKLNPNGSEAWVQRYNGPANSDEQGSAIALDKWKNIIVTGSSFGAGTLTDMVTIKYRPNGSTAWLKRYDGPPSFYDGASSLICDDTGNVFISGGSQSSCCSGSGWYDIVTIKYDSSGNFKWLNRYDGPGHDNDGVPILRQDHSGNLYAASYSLGAGTGYDYVLIKYTSLGDTAWVRRYDGSSHGDDYVYGMTIDASNNIYITGSSANAGGQTDITTIKYRPDGTQVWVRRLDGGAGWYDYGYRVAVDYLGDIYVGGMAYRSGTGYDLALIKYDPTGTLLWSTFYSSSSSTDVCNTIDLDSSGNIYVAGSTAPTGVDDFLAIKYCQQCPGTFSFTPTVTPYKNDMNSVVQADFDLDNYPDFAFTGGTAGDSLFVAYGTVEGSVSAPKGIALVGQAAIATGYVNGDTLLDLVVKTNSAIRVFLNDGNRDFHEISPTPLFRRPASGSAPCLAVGYFNNDPYLDVIADPNNVAFGDGTGAFPTIVSFPVNFVSVGAADFDGNGIDDAVVVANDSAYVYLSNGLTSFSESSAIAISKRTFNQASTLAGVDLNNDGRPDFVIATSQQQETDSASTLIEALGDGAGGVLTVDSQIVNGEAADIAVGDVNRDHQLDLTVINARNRSLQLYLGNGTGQFLPGDSIYLGSGLQAIVALSTADLNRDGNPDFLSGGDSTNITLATNQLAAQPVIAAEMVLTGLGGVDFTEHNPSDFIISRNLQTIAGSAFWRADIDHDGKLDARSYDYNLVYGEYRFVLRPGQGTSPGAPFTFDIRVDGSQQARIFSNYGDAFLKANGSFRSMNPQDSIVFYYTVAAFPSMSPANGVYTHSRQPVFRWGKLVDSTAAKFQFQLDRYFDERSPLFDDSTLTATQFVPPTPLGVDSIYYWRVRSYSFGIWSAWSRTMAAYIGAGCCAGYTGNVNGIGIVDLSDLSALVSYLTGGGFVLPCADEANVNASGIVDLSDLSALVSYLTGGGYVLPSCP